MENNVLSLTSDQAPIAISVKLNRMMRMFVSTKLICRDFSQDAISSLFCSLPDNHDNQGERSRIETKLPSQQNNVELL
jgi:hypothetical protein